MSYKLHEKRPNYSVVGIASRALFVDFSPYSCWITPDRGANWAFHGPVIAVLLVRAL